jgi:hypothetical protein
LKQWYYLNNKNRKDKKMYDDEFAKQKMKKLMQMVEKNLFNKEEAKKIINFNNSIPSDKRKLNRRERIEFEMNFYKFEDELKESDSFKLINLNEMKSKVEKLAGLSMDEDINSIINELGNKINEKIKKLSS